MEEAIKTLQNNKISQFLLRIDIMPGTVVDFKGLAEALSVDYGSVRTELHVNYNVDMQKVEVNKEEFLTYVLGKAPDVTLRLDCFERSIILASNHYADNSIYKERIHKLVTILKASNPEIAASRIGMRYINTFPCSKPSEINKYLNASESNSINLSFSRNCT